ncbi:MAG TPA: DUF4386 family protein [Dehalococcoidia bacterium]|nr:DUF4386 family protein [Dehalococcoidia bacterium]
MRTDVFRMSGLSALLFAAAFIGAAALGGVSGVDVYIDDDEIGMLLEDIRDNEAAFAATNIANLLMAVFLIPIFPGLFYAAREEDRPWVVVACSFMLVAAVFMLVSGLAGMMLVDTQDYFNASGPLQEAIGRDFLVVLAFHVFFFYGPPIGIGLLIMGLVSLRSGFFHKAVGWIGIVAGLGGISIFGWFIVLPGLLVWSLAIAWSLLRPRAGSPRLAPAAA